MKVSWKERELNRLSLEKFSKLKDTFYHYYSSFEVVKNEENLYVLSHPNGIFGDIEIKYLPDASIFSSNFTGSEMTVFRIKTKYELLVYFLYHSTNRAYTVRFNGESLSTLYHRIEGYNIDYELSNSKETTGFEKTCQDEFLKLALKEPELRLLDITGII
jgi:hypothetical protein